MGFFNFLNFFLLELVFSVFVSTVRLNCDNIRTLKQWKLSREEYLLNIYTNQTTPEEVFCNSTNSCFAEESTSEYFIGRQIKPIIVQSNAEISFYIEGLVHGQKLTLYRVEEINFNDCNTSYGQALIPDNTTGLIVLNEDVKVPGSSYFIVDNAELCINGSRINVTVTSENCTSPENNTADLCNGNGICAYKASELLYTCHCCDGFSGNYCQVEDHAVVIAERKEEMVMNEITTTRSLDPCTTETCRNNGTCFVIGENRTMCLCSNGHTGPSCDLLDECLSSPCINGICIQENNSIECYCHTGYYGSHCEKEYNECSSNPCQHAGLCEDLVDNYRCHCTPGYTGKSCTKKVNMCKSNRCKNGSVCVDTGNRYICVCRPGFTGTFCGVNIDDCASHPCYHGGTCHDLINGFKCHCAETHAGNQCEFSLDVFAPPLESEVPDGKSHTDNLYIVAGTLLGALFIVLAVVAGCYCKIHETYKHFRWRRLRYSISKTPSEASLEVASVNTPRLSIDAIWEATALTKDTTYRSSNYGDSLQTKVV